MLKVTKTIELYPSGTLPVPLPSNSNIWEIQLRASKVDERTGEACQSTFGKPVYATVHVDGAALRECGILKYPDSANKKPVKTAEQLCYELLDHLGVKFAEDCCEA